MDRIIGFINCRILADADFLRFIGPLVLFGIYVIGALAKKTVQKDQDSGQQQPSELQKAVRRRYQEIYAKQTGQKPPARTQAIRQPEPVKTAQVVQPTRQVEMPKFVRTPQPAQKTYQQMPQIRQQRPVQQQNHLRQPRYQRPVAQKSPRPKQIPKPQVIKTSKPQGSEKVTADYSLISMIRQPKNLRTAIILKEILDKPLALRDF